MIRALLDSVAGTFIRLNETPNSILVLVRLWVRHYYRLLSGVKLRNIVADLLKCSFIGGISFVVCFSANYREYLEQNF